MGRGGEAHRARATHLFALNNGTEQRVSPQLQRLRATQGSSRNQNLALLCPGLAVSYPSLLSDFYPVWPCHLFLRKTGPNACHSWRVGAGREADAGTGGRMEGRELQNNEVSLPRLVGAHGWQWWLKAFEMAKAHWQRGQLSDSLYGWMYLIVKEPLHSLTGTSTQPTSLPWLHSKSPDGFFMVLPGASALSGCWACVPTESFLRERCPYFPLGGCSAQSAHMEPSHLSASRPWRMLHGSQVCILNAPFICKERECPLK